MIKLTNKTPYYISDKLNQACKEYNRFYEMSEKSNHQDISTNSVLSMCYQVLQEEVENCLFQNDICENEVLYQALFKDNQDIQSDFGVVHKNKREKPVSYIAYAPAGRVISVIETDTRELNEALSNILCQVLRYMNKDLI